MLISIKNATVLTHISFFLLILLFNVLMSFIIDKTGVNIVRNTRPFGLEIGLTSQILLVLFITLGSFYLHFLKKFPIPTLLILAGSYSNLLERIFLGSVKDYIPLPTGYANLADFELWTGLILLNMAIWFPVKLLSKNK